MVIATVVSQVMAESEAVAAPVASASDGQLIGPVPCLPPFPPYHVANSTVACVDAVSAAPVAVASGGAETFSPLEKSIIKQIEVRVTRLSSHFPHVR